jgi:hypothetical protein
VAATATRDGGGKVWALGFYSPGAALKMERREIEGDPAGFNEGSQRRSFHRGEDDGADTDKQAPLIGERKRGAGLSAEGREGERRPRRLRPGWAGMAH